MLVAIKNTHLYLLLSYLCSGVTYLVILYWDLYILHTIKDSSFQKYGVLTTFKSSYGTKFCKEYTRL